MELTYKKKDLVAKLKSARDDLVKEAEAWVEKRKRPRANAIEKLEEFLAYAKDPEGADKPKFSTDQKVSGEFQAALERAFSLLPGEGATVDKAPQHNSIKDLECRIDTLDLAVGDEITMDPNEYGRFVASCDYDF